MNYILFDDISRSQLLPFTFTRPVSEIRIGISTISEKWNHFSGFKPSFLTEDYLSKKYKVITTDENLLVNGSVLPDEELIRAINKLGNNQKLVQKEKLIALKTTEKQVKDLKNLCVSADYEIFEYSGNIISINNLWDIFFLNDKVLRQDFIALTKGRKSAEIDKSNKVIEPEKIFLEEGAKVSCSIINASTGPVYISKHAEVMEGCMIRGPFFLGQEATLKMGAKIYGATSIGPFSKVGGEVSNSVLFGYSNKAHDGFIGNSVIGEWCNLGADTNNSNLKNNYGKVKIWNYATQEYINSQLQFCGLFMGDHSKSGINTMFNTGTVAGVAANVFGEGFPPKLIPSFAWGGHQETEVYKLEKAIALAVEVYKRRGLVFNEVEKDILKYLFENKSS